VDQEEEAVLMQEVSEEEKMREDLMDQLS